MVNGMRRDEGCAGESGNACSSLAGRLLIPCLGLVQSAGPRSWFVLFGTLTFTIRFNNGTAIVPSKNDEGSVDLLCQQLSQLTPKLVRRSQVARMDARSAVPTVCQPRKHQRG